MLWQRLSSLCAPLYYNKNSHVLSYCCDPVVDEKCYYHAAKIIKKSYIIATKSVSPNVQEAQLRKAAPTCPSKRAIAAVL